MIGPTLRTAALLGVDLLPATSGHDYEDAVRRLHVALVMAVRERWGGGRSLLAEDAQRGQDTSERESAGLREASDVLGYRRS